MEIKNHVDAYYWVMNHPALCEPNGTFSGQVEIEIVPTMVNPDTKEYDEDEERNTEFAWWIEVNHPCVIEGCGVVSAHNWELDCGGTTPEEAIMVLYKNVLEKYGDYN